MHFSKRLYILSLGLTCAILLLLAACDLGDGTAAPTSSPAPEASPAAGAAPAPAATVVVGNEQAAEATAAPTPSPAVPQGGTLPIGIAAPIPNLTPWDLRSRGEEYVAELLYNGLVQLDDQLRPQPDLAEGWQASADGGVITFTVRSDVRWHDGNPLSGEDVAWTLNTLRALTPTNALVADLQSVVRDVRTPVSNTVVLSLTQAYAPLLADLAVPILPRHLLQDRTPEALATLNFWDVPIGSGPFRLGERTDQGITFARHTEYFGGAPNLEGVALVIAPEEGVAVDALNKETLLLAEFPPTSTAILPQSELEATLREGGIAERSYPENGSYFLAFNVRAERLFNDVRLRQALALAVDVPELVREVTNEQGQPLATSLLPAAWAASEDLAPREPDPEAARSLLEEAGWRLPEGGTSRQRDGITLTAQIIVRGDDPRRVDAAERIARAAADIGMRLEVTPVDFRTVFLSKLAPPYDWDLLLGSWVNAPNSVGFPANRFFDPDDYALFGAENIRTGPADTREGLRNIGGFSSPAYEEAARAARATYDPQARAQPIVAAQQVILRELPYLFLWTDRVAVVLSPKVAVADGQIDRSSPRYFWNIERWYLQE